MGTDRGTVWALNLDAELELGRRGKGAYRAGARVAELVRTHRARLAALLPAGHAVLDDADPPGAYAGFRGRAYCPTAGALAALARAGAAADPAPSMDVLRAVNDRAFACARFPDDAAGRAFVTSEADLAAYLAAAPEIAGGFLVKRRWSMSGRGHRRIARVPGEADLRAVHAAIRDDCGVLVEPFVAIEREAAIHGWLDEGGALTVGRPCVISVDARRAFASARRGDDELPEDERAALLDAAARVGAALHAAGYFGPFGVDAFLYLDATGAPVFRAISEVNARMTMALPIGLAIPE